MAWETRTFGLELRVAGAGKRNVICTISRKFGKMSQLEFEYSSEKGNPQLTKFFESLDWSEEKA